jgi:hypothetical protein
MNVKDNDLLIIVVYFDDIMFGCNIELMSKKCADEMHKEFEMYILGGLSLFIGL